MASSAVEIGVQPPPRFLANAVYVRLLPLLLTLGLGLRCYHYFCNPSMWHDEAALVLNVLGKSAADLLGPLYFSEAAPPLFLWIEKGVAGIWGDGTFALRLVPFLASCLALAGMAMIGQRLLSPKATLWLVFLFGCSDRLLWHSCEAKPYAVDVLVAVGLLFVVVNTAAWPLHRQLGLYACLAPVLIFVSYPACFLLGGLALSLLPAVVHARRVAAWLAYAAFLAAMSGSFLLLWAGPIQAQRDPRILECWQDMFCSWDRPWKVPGWTALRLVEVARYAYEPLGNVLAAVAVVGAIGLWRNGQRRMLALLVLPLVLATLAALLGQYPLGATRVMVFAAPAVLLLVAAGLSPCLAWLHGRARWCPLLLIGLLLFPAGQAAYRVGWPWPRFDSARAAAYVRANSRPGEAVVGTVWEHQYYFRDRPQDFRYLHSMAGDPPSLTGAPGRSPSQLWLLAAGKTAAERRGYLDDLRASGWFVRREQQFERTSVFYLQLMKRE
jgi:hypothetical protein